MGGSPVTGLHGVREAGVRPNEFQLTMNKFNIQLLGEGDSDRAIDRPSG